MTQAMRPKKIARTPLEALVLARRLITPRKRWTKHEAAKDARGKEVQWDSKKACSFCMVGALMRVTGDNTAIIDQCRVILLGPSMSFASFNDAPERRHKQVLATFDAAITQMREAA